MGSLAGDYGGSKFFLQRAFEKHLPFRVRVQILEEDAGKERETGTIDVDRGRTETRDMGL